MDFFFFFKDKRIWVKIFSNILDSENLDRKRLRARNSEGGDVPEKYFVVTNNELLRVKYLLVYSQKRSRTRWDFFLYILIADGWGLYNL